MATVLDLRKGIIAHNDLAQRLADDGRLGLDLAQIQGVIDDAAQLVGAADAQVSLFASQIGELAKQHPAAAAYTPGEIL